MLEYLLVIFIALAGFLKAVSDTVQHYDVWSNSGFSRFDKSSFWGAADYTWMRKYKDGDSKIVAYLRKTWFVWTTDVWHLSQTLGNLSVVSAIVCAGFMDYFSWWYVPIVIGVRALVFHVFYTYLLRLDNDTDTRTPSDIIEGIENLN